MDIVISYTVHVIHSTRTGFLAGEPALSEVEWARNLSDVCLTVLVDWQNNKIVRKVSGLPINLELEPICTGISPVG